jgi:hypothetical protein
MSVGDFCRYVFIFILLSDPQLSSQKVRCMSHVSYDNGLSKCAVTVYDHHHKWFITRVTAIERYHVLGPVFGYLHSCTTLCLFHFTAVTSPVVASINEAYHWIAYRF